MAEKEKRILITKCSSFCHALRVSCDPFDGDDGMYCDKSGKWVKVTEKECAKCKYPVLLGMSRQEAIERMAKAICLERHACISKGEMCGLCELWRNFSTHAEAALNALLSEGK